MATAEFGHVAPLLDRLTELGADPFAAMAPFRSAIDLFHEHTAPADWFEGLIKAYVGDGLANDFYREIAAYLDADTRDLIMASLDDSGHSAFVVDRVRAAIAADRRLGGRLALWGRRLMGEALTQAQRVAAERDSLTALLAGGVDRPGLDLAAIGRMFTRLTERHAERMAELGLDTLAPEADGAGHAAADLDVGELVGGHHDLAALAVGEHEDAAGGDRLGHGLLDALGALVGVDDELSGGVLDADLDLHGRILSGRLSPDVCGPAVSVRR